MAAAQFGQGRDIAGGAVVGGVQYPQCSGPVLGECPGHYVRVESVRDAELVVPPRFQPDRSGADLNQAREHGLVRVARHQHRFTGTQRRQRDRDVAAGRALHQDEALTDTPGIGNQPLCLEDWAFRAMQRVGVGQVVQVQLGQVRPEPRIQRPAALVAGAVEGRLASLDEPLQ